ncbi:MAG: transposase, partial [Anaerolineales bacterium]|nr:transposase [Anaerolineales bacterium]
MCNHTTLINEVRSEIHLSLDVLVQRGAQRMLEAALEAEVENYLQRHRQERDENGHALVVRNGRAQERTVHCGAGQLKLRAPRVHDKRDGKSFTSSILPPYMRKTPRLEEAVPVLYLRGLSTGDFQEALSALLGEEAIAGFSATTVTRLLSVWQDEYKAWRKRPLTH